MPPCCSHSPPASPGGPRTSSGAQEPSLPLLNVLLASQLTGLVLIAAFVAIRGEAPPGRDFASAPLSAVAGMIGLAAFYRALAIGNMGVVAPISACAAVVPVVVGLAAGDRPAALQMAGLAAGAGRRRARLARGRGAISGRGPPAAPAWR